MPLQTGQFLDGRVFKFESRRVLRTVISYGFKELGLNRIEATPLAKNSRSSNVLVKLGFTHEGTLRQRVFFRGFYEDLIYFGLLRNEWTEPRD